MPVDVTELAAEVVTESQSTTEQAGVMLASSLGEGDVDGSQPPLRQLVTSQVVTTIRPQVAPHDRSPCGTAVLGAGAGLHGADLTSSRSECSISHMNEPVPRSTADARRAVVVARAVPAFARTGYWSTPVADVAEAAGISPAYVFRLFTSKLGLFVAALDHCFDRVVAALEQGAERVEGDDGEQILSAMGDAYAELIADRDLLMLQVHALSATDVPEITQAVRRGAERVVTLATERSGAPEAAVQQFVAYGQLCHFIVAAGLQSVPARWATVLTDGMAHPTVPTEEPALVEGAA